MGGKKGDPPADGEEKDAMGRGNGVALPSQMATACQDGTIRVFDPEPGRHVQTIEAAHGGNEIRCVVFSNDGRRVVTCGDDGLVKEWDLITGILARTLAGHRAAVWSVCIGDDGETWASGGCDKLVKVWGIGQKAAEMRFSLSGHADSVLCVSLSPKGAMVLASSGDDKTVMLWDTRSGMMIRRLDGHSATVWGLSWSPAPAQLCTLASCSSDGTIIVWDTSDGTRRATLKGHEDSVLCVSYSPDGAWLASGGADRSIRLWVVERQECAHVLGGHSFSVLSVAFDPSSSTLVSSGGDKTVRVWDVAKGKCSGVVAGHGGIVYSASFAPSEEDARGRRASYWSMTSEEKSRLFWIIAKQLFLVCVVIFFWIFVQEPAKRGHLGFKPPPVGTREL